MTERVPASPFRAIYLGSKALQNWSSDDLARWAAEMTASGLNTVIAKAGGLTAPVIELFRGSGVRVVSSIACYSDHLDAELVPERARAVDENGELFEQIAWYRGVIPTDADYTQTVLTRAKEAAATPGVEGVVLDFLRWPIHWETELHDADPAPPRGSYDPQTLATFRRWLDRHGLDAETVPDDPRKAAELIDRRWSREWLRFRCEVITELARELGGIVHDGDKWVGMFTVPVAAERRLSFPGQDLAALTPLMDLVLPMTYHGIMAEPASWPATATTEMAAGAPGRYAPAIQCTADPKSSNGNPWGAPISPDEFATVAAELDETFGGFFIFPGNAVDQERQRALAAALDSTPTSSIPSARSR